MKITDTISVNPSKTALGHVETTSSVFRSPVLGVESQAGQLDIVKVLFPSCSAGFGEFRKYEVPLRTLFATILIVTGISMLTTSMAGAAGVAICSLCFGAFLALGLFTRPVMLGAAVFYCINGALAIRSGSPDLSVFSLIFGCLIFCVLGGGKYSCDTIIRNLINRHKRKAEELRKENYMGYKAFHKANF